MKKLKLIFKLFAMLLFCKGAVFSEETDRRIPLSDPPQNLLDESGHAELDLIDPFQRFNGGQDVTDAAGFSLTSLGEVSNEFRILGIVISEKNPEEAAAMIQLTQESEPYLVHAGDMIQISRKDQVWTRFTARQNAQSMDMKALEKFAFYLEIKAIKATYIEAYQKKKPNESIYLRW